MVDTAFKRVYTPGSQIISSINYQLDDACLAGKPIPWNDCMPDKAQIRVLPTDDIAHNCGAETQRYLNGATNSDTRYCYELFRRAIDDRDETAFTYLCRCYEGLVAQWVRSRLRAPHAPQDIEECVNWAFASMFRSLARTDAFARFSNLESLLSYLRNCAISAAETENRRRRSPEIELSEEMPDVGDDLLGVIIRNARNEQIRQIIESALKNDRERTVYECYFNLGLPPRTIYDMYSTLFQNIQDVHRTKQIMLERIGRILSRASVDLDL